LEEHIAALQKSGKKLQESEGKYRALFEQSTHSIILYDPDTRMHTEFNDPANESLGYTRDEFKKLKLEDYCQAPPEGIEARMRNIFREGRLSYEGRYKRKNGEIREFTANARLVDIGGKSYILVLLADITDRKRAETERRHLEIQLRQAQKMESLGTLAGGIAHDFNNILGVILGYSELSLMELPDDPSANLVQYLDNIVDATTRARDLVHQILTFSRRGDEGRKAIDVNLIVMETLKLLRPTLPRTIDIRRNIPSEPSIIMGSPTQLQQIIMNLCTNSLHSMQGKPGVLEISIRKTDGDSIRHERPAVRGVKPRPYIQITVSDTGHGIDREIIDRVFDPYFTTKEPDEGTGLGLSVVHGIVLSYGGHIDIDSQAGRGTVVRIWFPAVDFIEVTEEEGLDILPTGAERILLVDDEDSLLIVQRQMLEQLHYRVVFCKGGQEALNVFRGDPGGFDLIVTDMAMPGMTGTDLAKEILKIRPGMPIILNTGFSEYMDAQKAKAIGISEYLMKPLNKRTLATVIRKVLDGAKLD
jgi:PAS domain S-box-containing protein